MDYIRSLFDDSMSGLLNDPNMLVIHPKKSSFEDFSNVFFEHKNNDFEIITMDEFNSEYENTLREIDNTMPENVKHMLFSLCEKSKEYFLERSELEKVVVKELPLLDVNNLLLYIDNITNLSDINSELRNSALKNIDNQKFLNSSKINPYYWGQMHDTKRYILTGTTDYTTVKKEAVWLSNYFSMALNAAKKSRMVEYLDLTKN